MALLLLEEISMMYSVKIVFFFFFIIFLGKWFEIPYMQFIKIT